MPTPFDPWYTGLVAAEVGMASFASREGLDALSARRLGALLEAAAHGSPRYRRLLAGRDPGRTPLTDLPVARKPELMRHFSDWVSDPAISLDHLRRFIAEPAQRSMAIALARWRHVWKAVVFKHHPASPFTVTHLAPGAPS
jgi:phenylacetate-CoA ligase